MKVLQEAPIWDSLLVGTPHRFIKGRNGGFMRVSCKILIHVISGMYPTKKWCKNLHKTSGLCLKYHIYYFDMLSFDEFCFEEKFSWLPSINIKKCRRHYNLGTSENANFYQPLSV